MGLRAGRCHGRTSFSSHAGSDPVPRARPSEGGTPPAAGLVFDTMSGRRADHPPQVRPVPSGHHSPGARPDRPSHRVLGVDIMSPTPDPSLPNLPPDAWRALEAVPAIPPYFPDELL